jgi:hypothetical protein
MRYATRQLLASTATGSVAAVAVGAVLATSTHAQGARKTPIPAQYVAIQNRSAPNLVAAVWNAASADQIEDQAAKIESTHSGLIVRNSSSSPHRQSETSVVPRSIAARRPSAIRIRSPSWSTIAAGGLAWRQASGNVTIWKSASARARIAVPTITLGRRCRRCATS